MTPERWRRIEELYHAASARPAGEHAAFLADACGDDGALRAQVEALLKEPVSGEGLAGWQVIGAAVPAVRASMIGRAPGGYRITGPLGSGGMGEVYRAHDSALGRDVAVKILPQAFASDPDRIARLEHEARTLASLNHPGICAIYGVGDEDGIRFLVLELVDGETLAERLAVLAGRGGLPLPDAVAVARQIIDALEAAHDRGIVHRDLKPANIKVTPDGIVKLLDFGLAKAIGGDTPPGLTHAPQVGGGGGRGGAVLGTAAYMSPEQARGLAVDRRTDVWAFGCVLYEMLTGRPAFGAETTSDSIARILEREPDWAALPAAVPPSLHRLLRRCLSKQPKARLKDIADARLELDAAGEPASHGSSPIIAAAVPAAGPPVRPRIPWLPWLVAGALAAAMLVRESGRMEVEPENPLEDASFSYLTTWPGTESGARISPDGRFVLFLSDRERRFDLWLMQIGTNNFLNLTRDGPPVDPQGVIPLFGFSADGEVWFTPGRASGVNGILLMPLTGGAPRPFLRGAATGAAWSTDGTRLAYFEANDGDPIFVADRTGADARQILAPQKGRHNHHLTWSPDDQWIYYVSGFLYGLDLSDEMDVWRIRPSGGSPERLTRLSTPATFLTPLGVRGWLLSARSANRAGPWLYAFDNSGQGLRRASSGLEVYTSVSAARDGRRIVATRSTTTVGLWQAPLGGTPAGEKEAVPYSAPGHRALTPRFGGDSLFYLSTGSAGDGLFREQNGRTVQIWSGVEGLLSEAPAISRNGEHVALVLRRDGIRQLAIMAADGTGRRRLAPAIDVQGPPDWSPDGTFLVAGGIDEGGPALFKIPVDGGTPVRITSGDAVNPVLSSDGQLIVYGTSIVAGAVTLRAVRLDGTPVALPPSLRARPGSYRFAPGGTRLIYLPRPQSQDFWALDVVTGRTSTVTALADMGRLRGFDISPDGKRIVFDRSKEQSDVVLITPPQ